MFLILLVFLTIQTSAEPTVKKNDNQELIHLYHDQPMYLLLGTPNTKVQLSFKAKVVQSADLYVGYSQRIFWDLFKDSRPFRDVNYNPSVFYRFYLNEKKTSLDLIVYDHESNGKEGAASRSWDRAGFRIERSFAINAAYQFKAAIKAWVPYNCEGTNSDLPKYRGLYEVTLTLSSFLGPYFSVNDLSLRFYSGGHFLINPLGGGRELTLRLKGDSSAFLANAVFQIFQGYAENLLEYNQSHAGFRLGFGI